MAGLFGNAPDRRNPLMLPRVNERRYDDIASMSSSLLGRPAYNTGDVIAQILAGGLAGLSDRGRASAEAERSEAMMEAFGTLLGGGGGLGAPGTPGGGETFDMGSLLSQTSARSPEVSPSAAPVGPVGRRPIDGMDMPMGQPETDYFAGVAQSESGGQMIPNANGSGAFGTYQFMPATWQGLVEQYPDQLTPDGIRDPAQQEIAMGLYTDQSRGILTEALGREPSNAELYAAHALGPGGAVQFLQALEANPNLPMEQLVQQIAGDNAGVWMEQNPQFAGKSVSDMMAMYSAPFGGSSAPVQTAQAPAPAMTGAPLSAAPMQPQGMSPQQQQVIGFMLANGMENEALGLIAQSAFATPENNLPADVQEIQWFLSQPQEVQQFLLDTELMGGGGSDTSITLNNRDVGSIPPGYELIEDPQTGALRMQPIEGGPVAESQRNAQAQTERVGNIVLQDVGRALEMLENSDWVSGPQAYALQNVPGTGAYDIARIIDTIRANIGFEQLNAMRQSSPTGGALGQVTERELAFLQAQLGNLDIGQSRDQLRDNLRRVYNTFLDTVHGPGNGPERLPLSFDTPNIANLPEGVPNFRNTDEALQWMEANRAAISSWPQSQIDAFRAYLGALESQ